MSCCPPSRLLTKAIWSGLLAVPVPSPVQAGSVSVQSVAQTVIRCFIGFSDWSRPLRLGAAEACTSARRANGRRRVLYACWAQHLPQQRPASSAGSAAFVDCPGNAYLFVGASTPPFTTRHLSLDEEKVRTPWSS